MTRAEVRGVILRLLLWLPVLIWLAWSQDWHLAHALLQVLDVPLVLASSVNDLLSYGIDPAADQASRLVDWVRLMDGGGRFALAITGVFAAAALHGLLHKQSNRIASS